MKPDQGKEEEGAPVAPGEGKGKKNVCEGRWYMCASCIMTNHDRKKEIMRRDSQSFPENVKSVQCVASCSPSA